MSEREAARPGRGTIVVRGDLFSDSGYGRATRALAALLADCGRHLFGVSLHEHAARRKNVFPFVVISDAALMTEPRFAGCCVIHICLPDTFVMVPLAYNIGYFFWETEQFPPQAFWKAKLRLMDELWAPSHWQADVLRREAKRQDVAIVPWPQGVERIPRAARTSIVDLKAHAPQRLDQLANYLLRISSDPARKTEQVFEQREHAAGRSLRFDPGTSPSLGQVLGQVDDQVLGQGPDQVHDQVLEDGSDIYLAVQTDAPRKGLHLLLSAWLQFRQTVEGRAAKLVIKMSSIDVSIDVYRLHFHMSLAVRRIMRRMSIADAGIFFVYDRLSDGEMKALVASCCAFVSATMGEGFGGPLAEAFEEGIPVICPDHTSCADILGADYPLSVPYVTQRQKLWNNIDVYSPSSIWNIIDDQALVARLQEFSRLSCDERRDIVHSSQRRLQTNMSAAAVRSILADRLASII